MNIVFFETEPWEEKYLKDKLNKNKLQFFNKPLTVKNLPSLNKTHILSVFIYSKITKKMIVQLPSLRAIVTRSTGVDHIDSDECKKRKIAVYNISHYGNNTIAEHAFALVLALLKNVIPSVQRTKKGQFYSSGLTGFDIEGKTIGIIGLGKIGKRVVLIAKSFNMNIVAYDIFKDKIFARENNIKYVSLEKLLKESDIITLHCNLTTENYHLINKKNISLLKKNAYIINTARGGLVDSSALLQVLKNNQIAGVALDVLEEESSLNESKHKKLLAQLTKRDNVIITPHNAFNTHEAMQRILDTTTETIKGIIKNKSLQNKIQ